MGQWCAGRSWNLHEHFHATINTVGFHQLCSKNQTIYRHHHAHCLMASWNYFHQILHPCEKVMGLFFSTQIIYILFFVAYHNFRTWHTWVCIMHLFKTLIIGYNPVTLWIRQLDLNPMSRLSDQWVDDIEAREKRRSLACSRSAGGWYKLFEIIENLSPYTSRIVCGLGMLAVERSYPIPLVGRLFYRLCIRGVCYRDKDACGASRALWSSLPGKHAAKRECGYFCTACSTESGLPYKPRIAICHIKGITAIFFSLVTYPKINPYVDILIWSYP